MLFTVMLVTKQPVLRRFWYPVTPLAKLVESPQPFTLLGQALVLWKSATGLGALRDRCCHRTAKLSLGWVEAGLLRWPYHGWGFDAEGRCRQVPQLPDQRRIPSSYRVQGFRCVERYGYAWVCLDDPLMPIPEIPEAEDPGFRYIHEFYEPWRCSGLRLMENSFDNAHPHFVHRATFGVQSEPIPPKPDSLETTEFGLHMRYVLPVFNTDLQLRNLQMKDERTVRISEGTWWLPFQRKLKITYPNGLVHIIVTVATPIDDQTSQIVQFCLRNDSEAEAKAADIAAFDRAVTLEDQAILESCSYDTPLQLSAEEHMVSDQPGILMRKQLAALLKTHGETEQTL